MTAKETGILMSAPMVRATLRDIDPKSQTRRVISARHEHQISEYIDATNHGVPKEFEVAALQFCPYGKPGDRLWVKETFSPDATSMYPCPNVWYRASTQIESDGVHTCPKEKSLPWADCLACWEERYGKFKWRPSIFMPRKLSRITLEILSVRCERVQEISDEDAIAEGIEPQVWKPTGEKGWMQYGEMKGFNRNAAMFPIDNAAGSFRSLWDSINAARGFGWDKNPWVFVVEFKRV